MTVWNPNAPRSVGLEWRPRRIAEFPIDDLVEEPLAPLPSTVVETISSLYVGAASPFDLESRWVAEVFTAGSETPVNETCILIEPNVISNNDGLTRNQAGSAVNANLIDSINDLAGQPCANPAINTADYLTNTVGDINITLWFNVPSLVGKRILSVKARLFFSSTDLQAYPVVNYVDPTGGTVWRMFGEQVSDGFGVVHEFTCDFHTFHIEGPASGLIDEFDRATGLPWTPATVDTFKSTGTPRQIRIISAPGAAGSFRLYAVGLEVRYCDENRAAYGVLTNPTDGWNTVGLVSNWAKAAATNYRIGLRRGHRTAGSVAWLGPDDGDVVGPPGGSLVATVAANGTIASIDATPRTPAFAVALRRSDAATSVDGQPYLGITETEVYSGHSVEQELRGADGSTYRHIGLQFRDGATPGADLLVEVVRRSDGVVMFDVVFSPADFDDVDPARGWRRLHKADAVGAVLAAATQYALRLTTTGAQGSGWVVGPLTTTLGLSATDTSLASYGGTTDVATVGGVDVATMDLPGVVATVPAAPASITVDVDTLPLTGVHATKGTRLAITEVEFARVAWEQTALAGLFDRYEIERDDGAGYELIATVEAETILALDDYESLFGSAVCWRARVVRDDNVPSDWTTPECATLQAPGCSYVFTTNQDPLLACAFVDTYDRSLTGPVRTYDLPDADDVVLRKMHGRDGYVAFVPLERLGEAFTRRLLVQALVAWTGSEVSKFEAMRAISLAPVPYVCVRTKDGDRWYANVRVRSPRVQRTTSAVTVDVAVVCVAFDPFPMSITA